MFLDVFEWVHGVVRALRDLLYPPLCVGCGRVGSLYCPGCRDSVRLVTPPVCPLCGQPQSASKLCARCVSHPLCIDGIRSVALFEGTLREAIHRFKYNYIRELTVPLGEMLVAFWERASLVADLIVPVPLHARRVRERGYNQAALLAQCLGDATGMPVICDGLRRNRHTVSQSGLSAEERRRNVEGAFSCVGSRVERMRVLLVDDVCTTGATLEACSVALRAGGARTVWALTVARAM